MPPHTTEPFAPSADKLPLLQVLRALAAAMVVMAHAWDNYVVKVNPQAELPLNFSFGLFGVQIFFCISGFILAQSAAAMPSGWASLRQFARRRVIRIVPLYWAVTLVYVAKLWLEGRAPDLKAVAASLLFWPYAEPGSTLMRPVLGVGWTLNFEMLFYGLLALSLWFAPRWRFWAVAAVLLGLSASRHLGWVTLGPQGPSALYLWVDDILLYFLLGASVASAHAVALRRAWPRMPLPWAAAGLLVLLLTPVVAFVMGAWPLGSPLALAGPTCCLLLWFSVSAHGHFHSHWAQVVQRGLERLGDASYSTYLIHGLVLGVLVRVVAHWPMPVSAAGFTLAALLVCHAAGWWSYRWFEVPVTRWLKAR